ncbi:MAG: (2Fe-2S)-binding protein, partial [Pseudomonadota bacterium]
EGRVDTTIPAATDPVSGQPELKGAAVQLSRLAPAWFAFAATRCDWDPGALPGLVYWAKARTEQGWRIELAGSTPLDATALAQHISGHARYDITEITDRRAGMTRLGLSAGGQPAGAVFAGPGPVEVARDFVIEALAQGAAIDVLLAGRPAADQPDPGPTVCSCFSVGAHTIYRAAQEQGLTTLEEIGAALNAGTNCGSCRPEVKRLIAAAQPRIAAE